MKDLQFLFYIIPSLIVGILAAYFFERFFKNEEKRRRMMILDTLKKETISTRLHAYERLVLMLERIDFFALINRISSKNTDKNSYSKTIIDTVEKEFDYNISQQLYVSKDCWKLIQAAKKATISIIQKTNQAEGVKDIKTFKARLIKAFLEKETPCKTALNFLKDEARGFL